MAEELEIVQRLEQLQRLFPTAGIGMTALDAATLIKAQHEALESARSQVAMLGTPDDAINNAVLAQCDAALALARTPQEQQP